MNKTASPGVASLGVLVELAERLGDAPGPEQRVQSVLDCALKMVGAHTAAVAIPGPEGPRLHTIRGAPPEPHTVERCLRLATQVLKQQRPGDRRAHDGQAASEESPDALLAVLFPVSHSPLRGVLCLVFQEPRRFSPDEVNLLRLLADYLVPPLEQERLQAEQRFQAIFQHATEAILVADDKSRYIDANPAACAMLEMTREQLLDTSVFELAGVPEGRDGGLWSQFLAQGAQRGELELRTPAGRRVYVEYAARAHFMPGQHLSFLREVTRRHRAESLLALLTKASEVLVGALGPEEVLRAVPRLAVGLLGDWCLAGQVEEGQLQQVAAAHRDPQLEPLVQALAGYRPSAARMAVLWQALSRGEVLEGRTTPEQAASYVEGDFAARVRSLQPHAFLAVPLATRERPLGVLVLISSDPRWCYQEEDRVAAQELARLVALALENARLHEQARQALRLRQEMMEAVAHDLRTPLQALSLRAATAERRATRLGDRPAQVDAQAAQRLTRQMECLLQELVDMASIDAGRLVLERQPQSASELLDETRELFEALGQQQGVRVEARPVEVPLRVWCDHNRSLQVLSNLVGNALKFTREGGQVVLQVTRRGDRVVFSVSDTGVGIDAEALPHVFERYWRCRGAKQKPGWGLGLAIVKGIVEAQGGEVWAESQPGRGSTFSFSLPAVLEGARAEPALA